MLYGMTADGRNSGVIFQINPDGSGYSFLHTFTGIATDGSHPQGTLVQSGGVLYGLTLDGGTAGTNGGTVFKINANGTGYGLLYSFGAATNDGLGPLGSPVLSGNTLYGITSSGGTSNFGTIFKVNTDGSAYSVIHSFTGTAVDGQLPGYSALTASGTTLYGMTIGGGSAGQGVVFRMNDDGTGFTVLHSFNPSSGDGYNPDGGLILVGNTLYGMTHQGGGGVGTIFKINTDGSAYASIHTFAGSSANPPDGANPFGTLYYDGNRLYGTTPRGGAYGVGSNNPFGVLFGINTDGSDYEVLSSFGADTTMGLGPLDVIESNDVFFGMTGAGGSSNDGIVYSFTPIPEPSTLLLTGTAGVLALLYRRRRTRSAAD